MAFFHNLIAFLVLISVLVAVHEYGHYWVAKRCGIKVLKFSIGFGRPLFGWMVGETRWQVAMLPLGGYVKMLDEREGPVALEEAHRAFNRQSLLHRSLVVVAGPVANLLLAVLLYWGLFLGGVDVLIPRIGVVVPGSMAEKAGFQIGDTVEQFDGHSVEGWNDMMLDLVNSATAGDQAKVVVQRRGGASAMLQLDFSHFDKSDIDAGLMDRVGLFQLAAQPLLGEAQPGGPAALAGLRNGDIVEAMDGAPVISPDAFVLAVRAKPGKTIQLKLDRHGQMINLAVTPLSIKEKDGTTIGQIGIGVTAKIDQAQQDALNRHIALNPVQAFQRAITTTADSAIFSLKLLWRVVTGHVSMKQLSGSVGIAKMAGQAASLGWRPFVEMMCLISISLGVLNLLPIPVLDGGHLLYYSAELVRGRPLSEDAMELGLRIGVGILAALMVVTLYNDVARMVGG